MTKLKKAERDMLRFAFLEREGSQYNSLAVDPARTKANAAARATVERLRELGLVRGVALTEAGVEAGRAEHERVVAARRAHLLVDTMPHAPVKG